mgnify:CR=1 FL=1
MTLLFVTAGHASASHEPEIWPHTPSDEHVRVTTPAKPLWHAPDTVTPPSVSGQSALPSERAPHFLGPHGELTAPH